MFSAVVQFVSKEALQKALLRYDVLKMRSQEIPHRACMEDDIRALGWVGIAGCPPELALSLRQVLRLRFTHLCWLFSRLSSIIRCSSSRVVSGFCVQIRCEMQALSNFGELKGECPPPQNGHLAVAHNHQVKYYFMPSKGVRLPAVLPVAR